MPGGPRRLRFGPSVAASEVSSDPLPPPRSHSVPPLHSRLMSPPHSRSTCPPRSRPMAPPRCRTMSPLLLCYHRGSSLVASPGDWCTFASLDPKELSDLWPRSSASGPSSLTATKLNLMWMKREARKENRHTMAARTSFMENSERWGFR